VLQCVSPPCSEHVPAAPGVRRGAREEGEHEAPPRCACQRVVLRPDGTAGRLPHVHLTGTRVPSPDGAAAARARAGPSALTPAPVSLGPRFPVKTPGRTNGHAPWLCQRAASARWLFTTCEVALCHVLDYVLFYLYYSWSQRALQGWYQAGV